MMHDTCGELAAATLAKHSPLFAGIIQPQRPPADYEKNRQRPQWKIYVREGKTGPRTVIALPSVRYYLAGLLNSRLEYLHQNGEKFDDREQIFVLPNGKEIYDLNSTWRGLMGESGLHVDDLGRNRTLYSLRHTFATFRLIYGRVHDELLAKNMGV